MNESITGKSILVFVDFKLIGNCNVSYKKNNKYVKNYENN